MYGNVKERGWCTVQPGDFLVFVGHQRGPVVRDALRNVPSVVLGVVHVVQHVGAEHHQLLGDAPYVHAGAPEGAEIGWAVVHLGLDKRHLGTVAGGYAGGANTTGSSANDHKIVHEIVFCHLYVRRRRRDSRIRKDVHGPCLAHNPSVGGVFIAWDPCSIFVFRFTAYRPRPQDDGNPTSTLSQTHLCTYISLRIGLTLDHLCIY